MDTRNHQAGAEIAPRAPGPWSGLGVVVLYFLLQFAVGLVVAVVAAVAIGIVGAVSAPEHDAQAAAAAATGLMQTPDVHVATVSLTLVATAALMLWFIHRHWRAMWPVADPPGFGVRAPASSWYFPLAVAVGLAAAWLGALLAHALGGGHAPRQDISLWAQSVPMAWRIPLALSAAVVAPMVEEAVFRGVLLSGLMRRLPVVPAVLASAVVFGLVHLPDFKFAWYPVPTLVLLGVLLAWLRLRSGSLWTSVTAHVAFNAIAIAGWFLASAPHP